MPPASVRKGRQFPHRRPAHNQTAESGRVGTRHGRRCGVESGLELIAQSLQGSDCGNRDQRCNQTIFDCCRARFVAEKLCSEIHGGLLWQAPRFVPNPPCPVRARQNCGKSVTIGLIAWACLNPKFAMSARQSRICRAQTKRAAGFPAALLFDFRLIRRRWHPTWPTKWC